MLTPLAGWPRRWHFRQLHTPLKDVTAVSDDQESSLNNDVTDGGRDGLQLPNISLGNEPTLDNGRLSQRGIDGGEDVVLEARYKVEGTLGQGGMGKVFMATDTKLGRKVAIKRSLGEAPGKRMAVQRFLTEAKLIAALNHPNIVQIYDYGRAKDGPFLIMEYVDGGSLLDRCRNGAIPLEDAVDLACQLCDGLAKAHDLKIIHRDIKPANILLTMDGIPKLTDFGLAKAQTAEHGHTVTDKGAVLGTPDFMPPEQWRDAALVDHRSDLWSLAATVYQMLTGRSTRIILFENIPGPIQEVLAKALDEEKDRRYQSVREFRDALKTSMRSASVAGSAFVAGRCPACAAQNELGRKFCRACGESLIGPCLQCRLPMPIWEEICGECGAKQTPLVEVQRLAIAAQQAEAEGLLGDFEFDRAFAISTDLRDKAHPRMRWLSDWLTTFLQQVEKSRAEQTRRAMEAVCEAEKHEAVYDYLSAVFALEKIPVALHLSLLPGIRESAGTMLSRIKKTQGEVRRLEAVVKQRLAAQSLDGVLPEVEKLLALQPHRQDVQKLRGQLLERLQKLSKARDDAVATSKANIASHDYENALRSLRTISAEMITVEVVKLREQAENHLRRLQRLAAQIKDAIAAEQLDGLLDAVEKYLVLQPNEAKMVALRQSLVVREEKIATDIAACLKQSGKLEQSCRFDEAHQLLLLIPEKKRTNVITELLDRTSQLASLRQTAIELLENASRDTYETAIRLGHIYDEAIANARIVDAQFAGLRTQVTAEFARRQRSRRLLKLTGITGVALAVMLVVIVAELRTRSTMRPAALARAIQTGSWSDALAIDPENATALVGRAREKLDGNSSDIESAFTDLAFAGRTGGDVVVLKAARGDAHAARSRIHAIAGRLDAAEQDLMEARLGPGSPEWMAKATSALVEATVSHAEKSAKQGKRFKTVQEAVTAAKRAGAADQKLLAVWETYAQGRIPLLAAESVDLACVEARKYGLSPDQESGWWLELANVAAAQEDASGILTAVRAATAAGATDQAVQSLLFRARMIEAVSFAAKRDVPSAAAKVREASLLDLPAAEATLLLPDNLLLRNAVVADYRTNFEVAIARNDWNTCLQAAAAAGKLDDTASGWLGKALAGMPSDAIAAIPPAVLASFPPAAITALPPIRNSIGIALKLLPAGQFTMGPSTNDSDEKPREVTLTKPFYIGVYEVTNTQWKSVTGNSSRTSRKGDDHPVELVRWQDAVEFCRQLSELPEEKKAGRIYRLPTEAEWEYACRAGTKTGYAFGDDESRLDEYGWFVSNSGKSTHSVGQKQPNAWGLYDMHGNAEEWCNDWAGAYVSEDITDPHGPSKGSSRICRGGSYSYAASSCRSAIRAMADPSEFELGFRIAIDLSLVAMPEAAMQSLTKSKGLVKDSESLVRGQEKAIAALEPSKTERGSLAADNPVPTTGRAVTEGQAMATTTSAPKPVSDSPSLAELMQPIDPVDAAPGSVDTLTNSIGIRFTLCRAGAFMMGDSSGIQYEKPTHKVVITKPFYIGDCEVTVGDWKQVIGDAPNPFSDDDQPVEGVSWKEAEDFCKKLTAQPAEMAAGRIYRLPTEAEWEYACRAGSTNRYSFGDEESRLREFAWFDHNSGLDSNPVGLKQPNAWGLYDMHGNVSEWVNDGFDSGYYAKSPGSDPQGPVGSVDRVIRGGNYASSARSCRSGCRSWAAPSSQVKHVGFRVVMIPTGAMRPTP